MRTEFAQPISFHLRPASRLGNIGRPTADAESWPSSLTIAYSVDLLMDLRSNNPASRRLYSNLLINLGPNCTHLLYAANMPRRRGQMTKAVSPLYSPPSPESRPFHVPSPRGRRCELRVEGHHPHWGDRSFLRLRRSPGTPCWRTVPEEARIPGRSAQPCCLNECQWPVVSVKTSRTNYNIWRAAFSLATYSLFVQLCQATALTRRFSNPTRSPTTPPQPTSRLPSWGRVSRRYFKPAKRRFCMVR